MTCVADTFLTELAIKTAAELGRRAAHDGLSRVNERDHLQPCCASVAESIAQSWMPPPRVSTGFRFSSPSWPRVGRVDVALLLPNDKPVAVELKCGTGPDALGPCAWDALKLAFAIQTGEISAGYLVAATTASDWTGRPRGAELFDTAAVDTLLLRERFIDWWKQWERLGDPTPSRVPRQFMTRMVCRVPFEIDGVPWEVRVAALTADAGQIVWHSTLA